MADLSILIPSRNEMFLRRTIEDILEKSEASTEVITVLDGAWAEPRLVQDARVTVVYHPESIGQRAATNEAARLATGKYLMKVDAHCAFDQGFDRKMLEAYKSLGKDGDNVTMLPVMKNLHAFDWLCKKCGATKYQGPTPTACWNKECDGKAFERKMVWAGKPSPNSTAFRFDKVMHFQYWGAYKKQQKGDLVETMSIQGSCFMCTKERYFTLDLCSEEFNSWGQQGVEVACKTWLSGGRVLVNKKTWYAHMFRTQGGDFGFPYHNPQSKVNENREISKELFQNNKWPLATRKFQWLLDKFNPPEWGETTKGMIYYTDSQLDDKIAVPVRKRLMEISKKQKIPIVTSSLRKLDFGVATTYFPSMKRGYLAMFKQIMRALEKSKDDIIFFTEHDVLYHPSHFEFTPPDKDTFYYNENVWYVRMSDGHGLHYDAQQLSGLCGYREPLLKHFTERFEMTEREYNKLKESGAPDWEKAFNSFVRHMGFEPMTHGRIKWKNVYKSEGWKSKYPNIDLRHEGNSTGQRWTKDKFRNQKFTKGWTESDNIPGWGTFNHFWPKLQ